MARPLTLAGIFAHPDDETLSPAAVFAEGSGGTPDEQFTCFVDTATAAETAWRAPCQHRTQAADVAFKLVGHRDNWREVFATSAFVRVHPPPRPDEPPEASLLEAFDG